MSDTFNTGVLVDDISDAIPFTDGFSRAFGYACAAGDAVFKDFHGHGHFSVKRFGLTTKVTPGGFSVNGRLSFIW